MNVSIAKNKTHREWLEYVEDKGKYRANRVRSYDNAE